MRKTLIAAAVAAVTVATTSCSGDPSPRGAPAPATQTSGTADARTAEHRAEDTFIAATAVHLCTVQSTVYDDPKAMADAYNTVPPYPGISTAQVQKLRQRLTSDAAFAALLTTRLQQTCKPPTA
jgi:hypothetical protein